MHCTPHDPNCPKGGQYCCLNPRITRQSSPAGTPNRQSEPRVIMETPVLSKPLKDKTCTPVILVLYVLLIVLTSPASPHTPMKLTWQVLSQTGKTVWSLTKNHAVGTWWPQLTPDFCQLAAGAYNWDIVTQEANNLQKEMPTVYGGLCCPLDPNTHRVCNC